MFQYQCQCWNLSILHRSPFIQVCHWIYTFQFTALHSLLIPFFHSMTFLQQPIFCQCQFQIWYNSLRCRSKAPGVKRGELLFEPSPIQTAKHHPLLDIHWRWQHDTEISEKCDRLESVRIEILLLRKQSLHTRDNDHWWQMCKAKHSWFSSPLVKLSPSSRTPHHVTTQWSNTGSDYGNILHWSSENISSSHHPPAPPSF